MKELTVAATLEAVVEVQAFVEEELERVGVSPSAMIQISICVEEVYVNIAHYAFGSEIGEANIRCTIEENPLRVTLQFLDSGKPFDPLAKEDADITLAAEERRIGGLGILMVKKSMDTVTYTRENGKNILILHKILEET
ncbi:MAG: ATP-binding protein [Eubacteriales bacterium]